MSSPVQSWFGNNFVQLDPIIQLLHVGDRSILQGEVTLEYGTGIAGILGRRIGAKLGLPPTGGTKTLRVEIESVDGLLIWSRMFDSRYKMVSVFEPFGSYPSGYWQEQTGAFKLELGVRIKEGGWYWEQKKVRFKSISLPVWLFPSSHAYKRIVDRAYEFSVAISLPVLNEVVSYKGQLRLHDATQ